jgi:hypothetical protein
VGLAGSPSRGERIEGQLSRKAGTGPMGLSSLSQAIMLSPTASATWTGCYDSQPWLVGIRRRGEDEKGIYVKFVLDDPVTCSYSQVSSWIFPSCLPISSSVLWEHLFVCLFFEIGSHYVAQADLELCSPGWPWICSLVLSRNKYVSISLFIYLLILLQQYGDWTQSLELTRKVLKHLSHAPVTILFLLCTLHPPPPPGFNV